MAKFEEIRHIAEAASSAGLETRKILDGSLFSEAETGLLKMLKSSLADPRRRARLLDVLESRSEKPLPLSEIIKVFDKFSDLQTQLAKGLTADDIKLLRFTIKYFEDWFYRGGWTTVPDRAQAGRDDKPYAYFSVPAGIINLVTKAKELPGLAGTLGGFDQGRLDDLEKGVHKFAAGLLAGSPKMSQPALAMPEGDRQNAWQVFLQSERSFKSATGPYGNPAGDLYFLKTCLIAAEMNRRQQTGSKHIFIPDTVMPGPKNEYRPFDFSEGQEPKYNTMHYPTHRISYCKYVVEYLRRSA